MTQTIFVFGSNLAGRHGAGAALDAHLHWGARYGIGYGPTGEAYAIPTKDENFRVLPKPVIRGHVRKFIQYAIDNPNLRFMVTRIGCGLAGFTDEQIAPMFRDAPVNCHLPGEWVKILAASGAL